MAAEERWYFTKEEIHNSPSRKCGIDAEKELTYRQQGAKLIQDMGQKLQVTQLVINTAIVYMHRFYMFHPFTKFHRNSIAPAALFLAAKVEEQPRKLEHVIKVAHYLLCHHEHPNLDTQSEQYQERAQELVMNENILLQTLGFDVAIDHPHTHVVKCFQMVRTTTELAQTSYFMATNSLHMTTMCLQYRPSIVACVCIYIVCKWSNYEIHRFTEGKDWFAHVDSTVTLEMLEALTQEFLAILDKYPSRLKKLMNSGPHAGPSSTNLGDDKSRLSNAQMSMRPPQVPVGPSSAPRAHELGKPGASKSVMQLPSSQKTVLTPKEYKEYSEKREKERREREKERERAEMREKYHQSTLPVSSHHSSSSHPASLHLSSSHQRLQPSETMMRKPHMDSTRPGVPGSAVRGAPAFKEPFPKRDVPCVRGEEKVDKEERTSGSSVESSAKFVSDRLKSSSDNRHSVEWNQSRQLEYINKDRKDIKLEIKSDIKPIKDIKVITENKDHSKVELYSKHFDTNTKNVIKSEPHPVVKIKVEKSEPHPVVKSKTEKSEPHPVVKSKPEKSELKDDLKVQGVKEIKHNNSFIFNNNDFSLRDFLNPSEMPPEDIFDTEVDSKPPLFDSADFLPEETTHHKLNSPPRQAHPASSGQSGFSTSSASYASAVKGSGSSTSSSKQASDAPQNAIETKPNVRHSNPGSVPTSNSSQQINVSGNHSSEKSNVGNGLPSNVHNVPQSTQHMQPPSSRRKEKDPSPRSAASQVPTAKVKLQRLETTVLPASIKFDDRRHLINKEMQSPHKPNLPKDASKNSVTTTPPPKSAVPSIQSQQSYQSYTPQKPPPEHAKSESISIRIPRPEISDQAALSTTSSSALTTIAATVTLPPTTCTTMSTNSSSSTTTVVASLKNYKQEHSRHKHKKEKKHKHKEKDKHKDKEQKEHKKARKHKKKDKEKDKEREKEKEKKSDKYKEKDASGTLKITIMRGKGVCTPDVVPTNTSHIQSLSLPIQEKESLSSSSNMDTPGRIKLTIPKSRLQVNAALESPLSPPKGIPQKDIATTKMKLKIPKDNQKPEKERENRKRERDRSSPDNNHAAKIPRTSSYSTPQVLDATRWSSHRH